MAARYASLKNIYYFQFTSTARAYRDRPRYSGCVSACLKKKINDTQQVAYRTESVIILFFFSFKLRFSMPTTSVHGRLRIDKYTAVRGTHTVGTFALKFDHTSQCAQTRSAHYLETVNKNSCAFAGNLCTSPPPPPRVAVVTTRLTRVSPNYVLRYLITRYAPTVITFVRGKTPRDLQHG